MEKKSLNEPTKTLTYGIKLTGTRKVQKKMHKLKREAKELTHLIKKMRKLGKKLF